MHHVLHSSYQFYLLIFQKIPIHVENPIFIPKNEGNFDIALNKVHGKYQEVALFHGFQNKDKFYL